MKSLQNIILESLNIPKKITRSAKTTKLIESTLKDFLKDYIADNPNDVISYNPNSSDLLNRTTLDMVFSTYQTTVNKIVSISDEVENGVKYSEVEMDSIIEFGTSAHSNNTVRYRTAKDYSEKSLIILSFLSVTSWSLNHEYVQKYLKSKTK